MLKAKTKTTPKKKKKKITKEEMSDAICPTCGIPVETHRCRLCGATKTINSVSGNVIWMKSGRVIAAFRDVKAAYIKMAIKHGIPKDEWPKKFVN